MTRSLQDSVFRVPFADDVERYYRACDIVVSPFVTPHFSRAVIEAGAMQKPVVGSRLGGIIEVLDDGVVGLLAEPGNHEDLATKICYLVEHSDESAAMAQAGRDRTLRKYGADAHARDVMDVYDQVMQRENRAR